MLNEKRKEKNPFKPKIVEINYLNELITKYDNLLNNSTDNINNIITTFEDEFNKSRQIGQIPSDVIKLLKDSFDAVKSNMNDNKNYLNYFFTDLKKYLKRMEKDCLITKVRSKLMINNAYKKQISENMHLDNLFSNKTNINNNMRKSNTTTYKRYNTTSNTSYDTIKSTTDNDKFCQTYRNTNISNISNKSTKCYIQLSDINRKLSLELNDKIKKIEKFKSEIESKNKEIEILKNTLNNKGNQEKKELVESIFEKDNSTNSYKPWNALSESVNRIMDNYKIENEILKKDKRIFQEKINYLQNELINKIQTNLEIKNEYNKIISDIKNKAKELEYLYNKINEEKDQLKVEIAEKELQIFQLQIQMEDIKNTNNILIDKNESDLKMQINELNKNIEEKNKYAKNIIDKEKQLRLDNINEDLIKELKKENKDLKKDIEKYKYILKCNNKILENEDSNKIIKDNDEKKILQIQFNKFEELQIKYNELECNYNKLLKNGINNDEDNKIQNLEKENEKLKNLNSSLICLIDGIKRSNICYKTEDEADKLSVEYDLKRMAKEAQRKNNSQDLNIDYPWYQTIKDKYREKDYKFINLEYNFRKLLRTIQINDENKKYIEEINKIFNN